MCRPGPKKGLSMPPQSHQSRPAALGWQGAPRGGGTVAQRAANSVQMKQIIRPFLPTPPPQPPPPKKVALLPLRILLSNLHISLLNFSGSNALWDSVWRTRLSTLPGRLDDLHGPAQQVRAKHLRGEAPAPGRAEPLRELFLRNTINSA